MNVAKAARPYSSYGAPAVHKTRCLVGEALQALDGCASRRHVGLQHVDSVSHLLDVVPEAYHLFATRFQHGGSRLQGFQASQEGETREGSVKSSMVRQLLFPLRAEVRCHMLHIVGVGGRRRGVTKSAMQSSSHVLPCVPQHRAGQVGKEKRWRRWRRRRWRGWHRGAMCKQGFGICKDRGRVAVVWELVPSMSKAGFHVIPPVMDGAVAGVFWGRVVCAKLLQKVLPLVPAQRAGRSIAQGSP